MHALRNALNPLSTAATRWWCHSSLRAILHGKPRQSYRRGPIHNERVEPPVRGRS